jgi:hypothetical protein
MCCAALGDIVCGCTGWLYNLAVQFDCTRWLNWPRLPLRYSTYSPEMYSGTAGDLAAADDCMKR